jgi:DNA polymerase III sliding clamp (beta) subunit (PCNA family)
MDRKKLIEGLANVDPARSVTNANEVMKTFWFTGKRLMAYDGGMALSVPFPTVFQGAIQATLYPLLNSSHSTECNFEETEKGVTVTAGSSKFKLLSMDRDKFNFVMPKMPEDAAFPVADVPKFLIALKACKRSLGSETSEAAFRGVTMIASKRGIDMFAYDRLTLTHCVIKTKSEPSFGRVVVPTNVIDQLIRITDGATELNMVIDNDSIMARASGVTLWGTLVDEERSPRPFKDQVENIRRKSNSTLDITDKVFKDKLPAVLERAAIISNAAVDSTKTKVTVADGKISFHSKSARGVVDDSITPPKGMEHADVELKITPDRVLAGLELGSLSFTSEATILSNSDNSICYYISGD